MHSSTRARSGAGETRRRGRILGCLAGSLVIAGCAAPGPHIACLTPAYRPDNVFLYASELSPEIKRVAVLPLTCEFQRRDLQEACETLRPILQSELVKIRKFEVVDVDARTLRACTGRGSWTADETLPRDIFDVLRRVSGCDAVLFCQLTAYRAYEPLEIGWRLKLVNVRTGQTLWAVDEVLDAGTPAVQKAAREYRSDELYGTSPDARDWLIRNSPRQFGQYAAAQVLATLPRR